MTFFSIPSYATKKTDVKPVKGAVLVSFAPQTFNLLLLNSYRRILNLKILGLLYVEHLFECNTYNRSLHLHFIFTG